MRVQRLLITDCANRRTRSSLLWSQVEFTYLLLFSLVCLLELLPKLLLFGLLGDTKREQVPCFLRLLFFPQARLFQLCYVLRVHVQVLDAKLKDVVKAGVDISLNGVRIEQVLHEVRACDLLV